MADISPLGRIPVLFDAESHLYESGASLLEHWCSSTHATEQAGL